MKKYLGLSTILATSVLLTACTDDNATPSKPTSESTTITSSTNSSSASTTNSNNSNTSAPTSEVTTQSQAGTGQVSGSNSSTSSATTVASTTAGTTTTPASTTTSAAAASRINVGAISGGNLASVAGTYTAVNGGTYTIRDSKTIVYNADGQEKVLTITGYGQLGGSAVVNAVFSSIDGKAVDANTPSAGDLGAAFYFVPAGQAAPAGFAGNDDTSRDRVVTLNNAFYLS